MSSPSPAPSPAAPLVRWSGLALALGGVANFVHLHASGGHLTGAEAVRSAHWTVAHNAHFYAAILLLLGGVGLAVRQWGRAGRLGAAALLVSLVGNAMYVGTGIVTAFVWPVLGVHAPDMVAAEGPFFSPAPLPIIPVSISGFALGWLLLAIATARSRELPRAAGILLAIGAFIVALPPAPMSPLPWALIETGGALFALGTAWLGAAMWLSAGAPEPAPRAVATAA